MAELALVAVPGPAWVQAEGQAPVFPRRLMQAPWPVPAQRLKPVQPKPVELQLAEPLPAEFVLMWVLVQQAARRLVLGPEHSMLAGKLMPSLKEPM